MIIRNRIAAFAAGHIENEEKHFAADDVAEELVSEAFVFVGSFDDSRDIGDREAAILWEINDAHNGVQGCKRIGCGFWMGSGNGTEERGFSGIGISDEPDVGDRAEFEVKPSLLSRITLRVLPGHPVCGALEMGVSLAAVPAFAKQELLAILGQIGNGFLLDRVPGLSARPVDNRAYGNPDDGRRATAPVLAFSQPMTAATGADERFEEKRDQIVGIVIRLKNDVATVAAITAFLAK